MTALGRVLRELIAAEGPIGVDRYMALALGHPVHGYYMTRDPLGREGDFVTAPEISQMFGELLGLWASSVWDALGRPRPFGLVELGPGRGTLMADALRAASVLPGFREAARVHLVETSPALRDRQRRTLGAAVDGWHDGLDSVPAGPLVLLANEFLDALPVRQFVRDEQGWRERLVGVGPDGGLRFGLAPGPEPSLGLPAPAGSVLEVGSAAASLVRAAAARLRADGGAALFVDYGHVSTGTGDTLQAVSGHAFADPLARPGEQDLTAHVDFAALARAGGSAGIRVHGPVEQGAFLRALGIEDRAARLKARATAASAASVDAALRRLVDPDAMGRLFKVIALTGPGLTGPGLPGLPGLPPARTEEHAPC